VSWPGSTRRTGPWFSASSSQALTIGAVGGLHLAQILALRCAAVGARLIVETARQELWDPLLLDSGLDAARLAVQPVGRVTGNPGWAPPSPTAPILVIRDCGARPPTPRRRAVRGRPS